MYRKKEILFGLVVGLLAIAYGALYFDRGLDPFDTGLYAAEASRILDGGTYGGDFLAPYGPGRYYLIALLFSLFGATLKTQAALFLVLRGVVAGGMYLVARRSLSHPWAVLLAMAVTVAHGALHKSFFPAAVILNVAAYYAYRGRPGAPACLAAGLLCGASALFRVDAGIFCALSFIILLLIEPLWERRSADSPAGTGTRFRRVGAFCGGALLATLPVAVLVALSSDLGSVLQAEWQRTVNLSRFAGVVAPPGLFESIAEGSFKRTLLSLVIWSAPVSLGLLALSVVILRVRRGNETGSLEILALAAFGIPVMNQLRITPSFNHLLQAAPLALIAATILILRFTGASPDAGAGGSARRSILRAAGAALAVLPAACLVFYNLAYTPPDSVLPGSIRNRWAFTSPIAVERAGVFETPAAAAEIAGTVAAVERLTRPGDAILAGPFCPVVHFLSDRPPAVEYLEPFYYFGDERLQARMIESLEGKAPPVAVLGGPLQEVGGRSLARDARLLHSYIIRKYERHSAVGRFTIWVRK